MTTTLETVLKQLHSLADEKYRTFNEGLIPGAEGTSIGVRMPQLRAITKEICRGDWRSFLKDSAECRIYEITLLRGLVVASSKCDFEERLHLLTSFIPEIRNWAVCDCVAACMKSASRHLDELFVFLRPYLMSREEFEVRFAVVMLMDYFLTDEYIDEVLQILQDVPHEGYYVKMAVAWAVSMAYVRFPDKALAILKSCALDPWTHNKAIQKCRESRRVSASDKQMLLTLKRQSTEA